MASSTSTPAEHRDAVEAFYRTVGEGGRPDWAGESQSIHFGLDGDEPWSLQASLVETNRELARRTAIGPGCRVLDAGCGVGGSAQWLATELGATVTGITLLATQVQQARWRASQAGLVGLTYLQGDYLHTGLPPASFDVIWNLESLCHCTDRAAYVAHARELLAPGGRFGCIDVFLGAADPATLEDVRRGCAFGELVPPSRLAELLGAAGFVDVQVVDLRPRVLRSLAVLRDAAEQARVREVLAATLLGRDTAQRQAHAAASVACAEAVLSGALTYAYVGGRVPADPTELAEAARDAR